MQRQPLDDSVKIERTTITLRQKVLVALRNAILNFQLLPGDRLVERDLCDLLGVSRTSVREALRHLESEGLVEYVDGKGPRVVVITLEDAREIYELRCSLECMVVELFTLRASDQQLSDLEDALHKLHACFETNETVPIVEAATHFYETLFEGCDNRAACHFLRQLQARISFLRATSLSQYNRYKQSSEEMFKIVDAIKSQDPKAAHEACLHHIHQAAKVALQALAEQQDDIENVTTTIHSPLQVTFNQ